MRACWLKWVGRDWSISADYIWLNYSDANTGNADLSKSVILNWPRLNPVSPVVIDQKQAVAQIEKMERALSGLPADK